LQGFRFGFDTKVPNGYPNAGTTPRERLALELIDLELAIAAVKADL